jgi:hypothetical protein
MQQASTPTEQQLVHVLRRWSNSNAIHRWSVDWSDVLAWWARTILTRPEFAALDLTAELSRWDNHLEQVANNPTTTGARFPKIWKNAITNWLTNSVSYAARTTGPDHDHRTSRRSTTRRRGQSSKTSKRYNIKPLDAGSGE